MKYLVLVLISLFPFNNSLAGTSTAAIVPVLGLVLDQDQCEQTFNANTTFTVPNDITEVEFTLLGGEGGNGSFSDVIFVIDGPNFIIDSSVFPGFGARGESATSTLAVIPGQTFTLTIGQGGQGAENAPSGGAGGTGGAGDPIGENGQDGTGLGGSGGGGGAGGTTSAVSGAVRLVAQGGTGGGGAAQNSTGDGENGTDGGAGGMPDGGSGGPGATDTGQNSTTEIRATPGSSRTLSGQAGSITVNFCQS